MWCWYLAPSLKCFMLIPGPFLCWCLPPSWSSKFDVWVVLSHAEISALSLCAWQFRNLTILRDWARKRESYLILLCCASVSFSAFLLENTKRSGFSIRFSKGRSAARGECVAKIVGTWAHRHHFFIFIYFFALNHGLFGTPLSCFLDICASETCEIIPFGVSVAAVIILSGCRRRFPQGQCQRSTCKDLAAAIFVLCGLVPENGGPQIRANHLGKTKKTQAWSMCILSFESRLSRQLSQRNHQMRGSHSFRCFGSGFARKRLERKSWRRTRPCSCGMLLRTVFRWSGCHPL